MADDDRSNYRNMNLTPGLLNKSDDDDDDNDDDDDEIEKRCGRYELRVVFSTLSSVFGSVVQTVFRV